MISIRRTTTIALLAATSLLFAACGATTDIDTAVAASDEPVAAETEASASQPDADAPVQPAEPAEPAAVESDNAAIGEAWTSTVTFNGQEMTFENWQCFTLGQENLAASGTGSGATSPDNEFAVSWEQPLPGDGPNFEYTNTVSITVDDEPFLAGTQTGGLAFDEGSLSWERTGDVVTGTATVVSAWDPANTAQVSFVTNCSA